MAYFVYPYAAVGELPAIKRRIGTLEFLHKTRYIQVAFNSDINVVNAVLPTLPKDDSIIIEAGTPFIKREGMDGIRKIFSMWDGHLMADIKISDGAFGEVEMVREAGATAATVLGSSPTETLNFFIEKCKELGMSSAIDMLGVDDPLSVLRQLKEPPEIVVLHKGRDEESSRGKTIQYRHVNRIRSKFDVIISAAGGVDLKGARSAVFNGAEIVVVNIVGPGDPWTGIRADGDVAGIVMKFLDTVR